MTHRITSAALLVLATTAPALSPAKAGPASSNPASVTAGRYAVEPVHTRVQFSVSHMGFTNWNGDFTGVGGSLSLDPKNVAASNLDITIPVASISTTNAKLDAELKSGDWLGAQQFPTIHFVATRVVRTASNKATITGKLTLHGVTKPLVLAASFNGAGINPLDKHYTVGFDATGTIKRSAFGVNKYVPLVGDETTLHISAAFEKAN
jgi:polyisoprenoid-binding protein YceI